MTSESKIKARRLSLERSLAGYPFPDFDKLQDRNHPEFDKTYSYALNFANYTYEPSELKVFAQKFADMEMGGLSLSRIAEWEFFTSHSAWLHTRGVPMLPETLERIKAQFQKLYDKYNVKEKPTVDLKATRTGNLIGELDGVLDDAIMGRTVTQPFKIVSEAGTVDTDKVREHFQAQLDEVNDETLSEHFPDKKKLAVVLGIIIKDLDKAKTAKPVRKARLMRPRKINPTKMVRRLKYLKSDTETKLVSIDPEKIVGANILWVFNVKTRKLGKYEAKEGSSLMVKGSTILNFADTSVHKKVRKPADVLPKLMSAGKVEQRKLLESIRAVESPLTGRINKDTILVRVF